MKSVSWQKVQTIFGTVQRHALPIKRCFVLLVVACSFCCLATYNFFTQKSRFCPPDPAKKTYFVRYQKHQRGKK